MYIMFLFVYMQMRHFLVPYAQICMSQKSIFQHTNNVQMNLIQIARDLFIYYYLAF